MLAVNLGYRIDRANVENNNFSNNLSNPISRVMDWDNFAAMTYRNNRYIGLTGVGVFRGGQTSSSADGNTLMQLLGCQGNQQISTLEKCLKVLAMWFIIQVLYQSTLISATWPHQALRGVK